MIIPSEEVNFLSLDDLASVSGGASTSSTLSNYANACVTAGGAGAFVGSFAGGLFGAAVGGLAGCGVGVILQFLD